jgi:beta-lactam-binding protein with PASTA domain
VALGGSAGAITSFPDLTGLSARDALRVLSQLRVTARLQGTSGVVTQQYPPAGELIESASIVVLKLGRLDPDQIASAANHDRR